jgi:hypothetical protein
LAWLSIEVPEKILYNIIGKLIITNNWKKLPCHLLVASASRGAGYES